MKKLPILLSEGTRKKIIMLAKRPWVRRKLEGQRKLHLGCGSNVIKEWANIDLERKGAVIGWDLTDPLPVRSETVELIYCEHFIEHITLKQAKELLSECYRVLCPSGILRLSTPNLKKLVDEYCSGRTMEWGDMGWNPVTPCQMLNDGLRLWGHQFVYDTEELIHTLWEIGYSKVTRVAWRESTTAALANLECRPFHGEIILEATK